MTTPRYCVYGETMQYVSHLEATGPPLRIQISPEFKEKLNEVGGFETIIRGPVRVKVSCMLYNVSQKTFKMSGGCEEMRDQYSKLTYSSINQRRLRLKHFIWYNHSSFRSKIRNG